MKKKVIIVDDNKPCREIIKKIIEGNSTIKVIEATNGKQALNLLQNNPFDLLITDVRMPEMNGIELIDKLRERGSSIPIIVFSGVLNHDNREYLNAQKAVQIIEKPFSIETLAGTVVNIVS